MEMEMQHQVMGYDRAATMFSPDGRLLQVEYAEKTVRLGSASIGMVCTDGIIIVADKRLNDPLLVPEASMKIYEIDNHIIAVSAGILSDARVLVERAQLIAQQYRITYDSEIDVESVIKEIANAKQAFTQYGGARPYGVEIMISGINPDNGGKLFTSDVTGNYLGYRATAIGENDDKIKEELRKEYKSNTTIEQGLKISLNIFKKILAKDFDITRFEISYIKSDDIKIKHLFGEALLKAGKL